MNVSVPTRSELENGRILAFNKPANWTSFDVVNKLRSLTRVKKVGHAGTLDPFATGLLLVCFGKATKRVESLMQLEKEYLGTVVLGVETDTHDITGKKTRETSIPETLAATQIAAALKPFQGEILQVPPMFSALKHKGKKLYELARQGKEVERTPRPVWIYALEAIEIALPEIKILVRCSRGTYIRALARDLGKELGVGAILSALVRTRIGPYALKTAWELKQFESAFREANATHGNLS